MKVGKVKGGVKQRLARSKAKLGKAGHSRVKPGKAGQSRAQQGKAGRSKGKARMKQRQSKGEAKVKYGKVKGEADHMLSEHHRRVSSRCKSCRGFLRRKICPVIITWSIWMVQILWRYQRLRTCL